MKYNPVEQNLELTGFSQTTNFSIAATGKAFRNLMDGLYGRKVEAVVRELCTNAYDSHTAARTKHRAFTVKLPTYLSLLFMVRDYGVGMPHEQVMQRYSTLFDSTKDNSDEEVGMLGLGSKSPFAYTDGFTLRCYDGETRRTYACYLGNGGVPTISVADVSPCSEPRGVEVSFAVKREDCMAFANAAVRVLKGFPTMPLGVGPEIVEKVRRAPLDYGDGWALTQDDYLPSESNVWVLQGCVYYPVDVEQLLQDDDTAKRVVRGLGKKILLDVPVGTVEFTPGRETLSYTDQTKHNLRFYWEKFTVEINSRFVQQLQHLETEWERAVYIEQNRYEQKYGALFHLSPFYKSYTTIKERVREYLPGDDHKRAGKKRGWQGFVYRVGDNAVRAQYGRGSAGFSRPSGVTAKGQAVLFVHKEAGTSQPWQRLAQYMLTHGYGMALGWETDAVQEPWLGAPDLAKFGHPPVVRLSRLPLPPPVRRPSSPPSAWLRTRHCSTPEQRSWNWSYDDPEPGTEILFEYNEMIVEPEAGVRANQLQPLFSIHKALEMQKLLLLLGKPGFSIVRLRGGEVVHRWRKYPLHQKKSPDVVAELSKAEVRRFVNVQNYQRFESTFYGPMLKNVTSMLEQPRKQPSRSSPGGFKPRQLKPVARMNPITALQRFGERLQRIPREERLRVEALLSRLDTGQQDHLVTRALQQGLEVLPEPGTRGAGTFPYDLLPLHWENLARMLANSGRIGGQNWSLALLMNKLLEVE